MGFRDRNLKPAGVKVGGCEHLHMGVYLTMGTSEVNMHIVLLLVHLSIGGMYEGVCYLLDQICRLILFCM